MANLKEEILKIAKEAVENHVNNKSFKIDYSDLYLKEKRACFVCLKIDGILRGCMGTLTPVCVSLVLEIEKNAVSAAVCDSRFRPVTKEDLPYIKYSVDVLSPAEEVRISELDAKRYGVIVKKGAYVGVLLPDLEGIETVEQQLSIAKEKAGIMADDDIKIYRFKVDRFE